MGWSCGNMVRFGKRREGRFSLERARATPCCEKNLPWDWKMYVLGGVLFGFPKSRLGPLNIINFRKAEPNGKQTWWNIGWDYPKNVLKFIIPQNSTYYAEHYHSNELQTRSYLGGIDLMLILGTPSLTLLNFTQELTRFRSRQPNEIHNTRRNLISNKHRLESTSACSSYGLQHYSTHELRPRNRRLKCLFPISIRSACTTYFI